MILWAARVREPPGLTVRCEAWDAKKRVTFAETLAMVRRWRWAEPYLQRSHTAADRRKVPRALYERLTETLCYAAYMDKVELRQRDGVGLADKVFSPPLWHTERRPQWLTQASL
jgi:hypothetical protein